MWHKFLGEHAARCHHIYREGVHRISRTNPVDSSTPKVNIINNFMHCILNSKDVWFCPPQCGLYSVRAQNKPECLSPPVDPDISKAVTDLYPSRGSTPVARAIEVSHAACKAEFGRKSFLVDLTHTA